MGSESNISQREKSYSDPNFPGRARQPLGSFRRRACLPPLHPSSPSWWRYAMSRQLERPGHGLAPLRTRGIAHLAMVADDMPTAMDFYTRVTGFQLLHRAPCVSERGDQVAEPLRVRTSGARRRTDRAVSNRRAPVACVLRGIGTGPARCSHYSHRA